MQISKIVLALLPAVAVAAEESAFTTTHTSTAVLTKTYYLSSVHTVTSVLDGSTSTFLSTAVSTAVSEATTTFVATSATATATPTPSQVTKNAGSALEAGKLAIAGVAGMAALALM